ncbi:MAG TPA: hypothetical protein VMD53_06520 [Rhizomicrobium sp.]|nr:hypothetical protein [Rhizomicrobium sp.]
MRTAKALMAALAFAALPSAAHADAVTTEGNDGFGRIIFNLDPIAHVKPALAGGVLTLSFDRKVAINANAIVQGLPGYIAGGRADPDGKTFRFALTQNARLHESSSADRVAIDLVPNNYPGVPADLPPPPPKEATAVEVSKLDVLKIRAGAYANFSRLIFDWPKNVPYAVFPGAGHITIRFEAMARPDFTAFENVSPPWVKEAGWRVENKGTVIEFTVDPQSGYKDSRDGSHVLLDILAPKTDAQAATAPATANKDQKADQTPNDAAAQAKVIAAAAAQLSGAKPDAQAAAAKPATPAQTPPPNPLADADMAQAMRTRQGVALSFPGAGSTPSAIFVRGMTAWIVIDRAQKMDPVQFKAALGDFPTSLDESTSNNTTIIRIGLKAPEEIAARADGSNLRVDIAPQLTEEPASIGFVRDDSDPRHTTLTTLIPESTHTLLQTDPSAGDTLVIVPGVLGRGVLDARRYAEFAILPTASGLVVRPLADDLDVLVSTGHVTITRPGGLAMTRGPISVAQSPQGLLRGDDSPSFLDLANWANSQGTSFYKAQQRLRAHIAAERSEDANHARLALARFYLGNQFAPEALGLINIVQASDPSLQGDMRLQTMRAAADYMMQRYRDAHNDIGSGALDNDRHAAFWRGLIEAKLENWNDARKALAMAEPVLRRYAPEWQARARLAEAEAAIVANAVEVADSQLNHLPHDLPRDLALQAQLERARLYATEGRYYDAQELFTALEHCGDERIEAKAVFDGTQAGLADGAITRDQAIAALEALRFRWRGDSLELRTLRRLGALYFEKKDWREGLYVLRIASQNFPDEELARQAQDDMRATFVNLFLKGKADAIAPIQALSLFYDFIDLTPIGPEGDEMIRRMTDRLVAVDLLDPAEKLLNYQVTKRLDGIARAQVATRLAMIDLMDHKPKDALASLRATEIAGLPDNINHGRVLLEARALAALKQWDQALDLIAVDEAPDTRKLRADIYWESGNWAVAAQMAEQLLGDRWNDAVPLDADERQNLMRAAIAYSLADDEASLDRLRTRFGPKMKSSPDASAFAVVTQNIDLQGVAFRDMAGKIASIDTLEGFIQDFKKRFETAKAN